MLEDLLCFARFTVRMLKLECVGNVFHGLRAVEIHRARTGCRAVILDQYHCVRIL